MADVERLELGEREVARLALAVGAAIDGPVVEQDHAAVLRRRDIDLDHRGAEPDRPAHRFGGIFEHLMLRRIGISGRAGVAAGRGALRSEEHTPELPSLRSITYAD